MSADWGVYVHVPWCRRRCPYCAFYVEVDRGGDREAFVTRALAEADTRGAPFRALGPPATVFLGGGTPSRLAPAVLQRLIAGLGAAPGAEVTIETNPEDVDAAWPDAARDAGVTRPSLGLQTLDPRFARLLNRACTVDHAADTLARVAAAGFPSWSVDLIFALPDQTLADVDADLDRLLAHAPPHVSLYGLTYEAGTPFGRARDQGRMAETDDGLWRAMYERIVARLAEAGLERYEVSNFARPGHRSRHNRLYWTDRPYLGLGPSAHGYRPDGSRYANVRDVAAWTAAADPTAEQDPPDPETRALDLLVSAIRGVDGVPLATLAALGYALDPAVLHALGDFVTVDADRVTLAGDGWFVADAVVSRLARALRRDGAAATD